MMFRFTIAVAVLFYCVNSVFSHSGETDGNEGHYDTRTGEYHYHEKKITKFGTGREMPPKKYLGIAFVSSFLIVGGGQVYNGHYKKAGTFFGGFALGALSLYLGYDQYEEGYALLGEYYRFTDEYDETTTLVAGGCLLMGGCWLLSMIDAVGAANEINREYQQSISNRVDFRINPIISHDRSGAILAFRW